MALSTPGRPALQARSRKRRGALLAAFRGLLEERPFAEIAVADIARRARTSVGGVYARFASKEALLLELAVAAVDDMTETVGRELGAAADRWTLRRIVATYTREMVAGFRRHRTVLLQASRNLSPGAARRFHQRVREFNALLHDRMRALLLGRRREIRHGDAARAANLALFMAAAAAREAVITGSLAVYPVSLDDAELAGEIARGMEGYLRLGRRGTVP